MKKITLIALAVMATATTFAATTNESKNAPEERTPELNERHVAHVAGLNTDEVKTLESTSTRDTKKAENKSDKKAEKKNNDMSYLSITLTGSQFRKYRNHTAKSNLDF